MKKQGILENQVKKSYLAIGSNLGNKITNIHMAMSELEKNKIPVTIRKSRGKDIDAACGQLANNFMV